MLLVPSMLALVPRCGPAHYGRVPAVIVTMPSPDSVSVAPSERSALAAPETLLVSSRNRPRSFDAIENGMNAE